MDSTRDQQQTASPGSDEFVTLVVRHGVKAGKSDLYEHWLRRIIPIARDFPGHLGANILRPASEDGVYTIILRFDTADHLHAWVGSPERRRMIAQVEPILQAADNLEVTNGASFWFTPSTDKPPRWKQAVLTLAVIYPLTKIVPALWAPVFAELPRPPSPVVADFLITATLVALVVYLIMPQLSRRLAGWLRR